VYCRLEWAFVGNVGRYTLSMRPMSVQYLDYIMKYTPHLSEIECKPDIVALRPGVLTYKNIYFHNSIQHVNAMMFEIPGTKIRQKFDLYHKKLQLMQNSKQCIRLSADLPNPQATGLRRPSMLSRIEVLRLLVAQPIDLPWPTHRGQDTSKTLDLLPLH
jgi:hypothetical protein